MYFRILYKKQNKTKQAKFQSSELNLIKLKLKEQCIESIKRVGYLKTKQKNQQKP